ncbi:MAG: carbohydrate kinase family protein [Anaerolineales bacterium]
MNIVVTGSIAFDYLMSFPGNFLEHIKTGTLQKLSVSFLVDDMRRQRGGCAANIAYTLGLLGERPILMATAGQDFGEYREWLENHGVDTSAVTVVPDVFTASFFANTDREQNQIASFYTGAMAFARELSFAELEQEIDLVVISPNDPEAMMKYPLECKELGLPYMYDPSQQIPRLDLKALRAGVEGAEILIVNDYEYVLLKEHTGMSDEDLQEVVGRAVIVTRGAEGTSIWADGESYFIPVARPLKILDPTGVGDAFRAGLLKGLAVGLPWEAAGRIGSLAATYVLEAPGAQVHEYTLETFANRYGEIFGQDAFTERVLSGA